MQSQRASKSGQKGSKYANIQQNLSYTLKAIYQSKWMKLELGENNKLLLGSISNAGVKTLWVIVNWDNGH